MVLPHVTPSLPVLELDDESSACGAEGEPCTSPGFRIAAIHPDGAVAFWGVDGKAPQLYLTTGASVLRLGRQGGGPGEYRIALALGMSESGDVFTADLMQRRILNYGRDGRSLSTTSVPLPPGLLDLAFVGDELRAFATAVPKTKGDSLPVRVFALEPGVAQPRELYALQTRQPGFGIVDMRPVPSLFAAHALFQFRRDGHLFVTEGASFQIDEYDARGTHIARFGFDVTPRIVTESESKAARLAQSRRIPDPKMRESLESAADSVQWIVFSASARPRGRILLAASEMVLGSHGERLLVSREDESSGAAGLRWMRIRE